MQTKSKKHEAEELGRLEEQNRKHDSQRFDRLSEARHSNAADSESSEEKDKKVREETTASR